jgi:hypothetical protein
MQQNQHRKQQMMLYHQQQRQAIRERLYPGKKLKLYKKTTCHDLIKFISNCYNGCLQMY